MNYYGVSALPTLMIDGLEDHWPISQVSLGNAVDERQSIESPIAMNISATTAATSVEATVIVTSADVALSGNYKLRIALANTEYTGFTGNNGQSTWHYDMLDMAPSHSGQDFSIGTNETLQFDVSFDWPITLNGDLLEDDNLTIIAYVQNDATHEIIQSEMSAVDLPDFMLTATPLYDPYYIMAGGGTLTFDVNFVNNTQLTMGLYYFTNVVLPNGSTYGPLVTIPFNMTAFMNATVTNQTQVIPATAPSGTYEFITTVGLLGNPQYQIHDSFEFAKLGGGSADGFVFNPDDWTGSEFNVADQGSSPVMPDEFSMTAAYPNPFNPSTTVELNLPSETDLIVTVHNVTGQLVATLHNGIAQAGQHNLTFNASDLSAGLYFIRAAVPGHAEQVQKVMLVK